jgi:hypothetical protein
MYDHIYIPSVDSGSYNDYIDLMEEHGYLYGSYDDVNGDIHLYVIEGGYNESASEILSKHGLYHPEILNNN